VAHKPDLQQDMLARRWDMLPPRVLGATEEASSPPMLSGPSLVLARTSTMDLVVIRPRG
jgi:hypothetical protein